MIKIAPSILSADFTRLGAEIDSVRNADLLHFDVMDGLFVPNISFGIPVLKDVRRYTDMTLDVHLMIDRPIRHIESFVRAGADLITVHAEADSPEKISETVDLIRSFGVKAGVSVKPNTPASALEPFLERLDLVLLMTVEPGFGGQKLIPGVLDKIAEVRKTIEARGLACDISVDGGVNRETAPVCLRAGANILVMGSDVFKKEDRAAYIEELRGMTL